jgi:hypothetical protein
VVPAAARTGIIRRGERELRLQAGPGPAPAVEEDPAAERLHPVLQPDQAGAAGQGGAADAVVAHRDARDVAGHLDLDADGRGPSVLDRVGQRLGHDVVGADLDLVGQPLVGADLHVDGDRRAAGERPQRRRQAGQFTGRQRRGHARQAHPAGVRQHHRPGVPRRLRQLRHSRHAGQAFQHRGLVPHPAFGVRSQRLLADDRAPRQEHPGDAGALAGVHDFGPEERLRARPRSARFHRSPSQAPAPVRHLKSLFFQTSHQREHLDLVLVTRAGIRAGPGPASCPRSVRRPGGRR